MKYVLIFTIAVIISLCQTANAGPLDETRCCVVPVLNPDGTNKRSAAVLAAFQKIWPCPSTGLKTGACPGWQKDHVLPLECGGKDEVSNIAWMPTVVKAGRGTLPKDRWERKIYCSPRVIVIMPTTGTIEYKP